MTDTTARTDAAPVTTDHVEYDPTRAGEWLDSRSVSHEDMPASTYSTADSLGLDDEWPAGGDDDRLANVRDLIDRALDEDVILLRGRVEDVRLIETRNGSGVLTGARMLVETSDEVTLASDGPLWADNFTGGKTGRDGALAALSKAARMIDRLVGRYRAAVGHAPAAGDGKRLVEVCGVAARFAGDELDCLARTAGEAVHGDGVDELSGRQLILAKRAYDAHMADVTGEADDEPRPAAEPSQAGGEGMSADEMHTISGQIAAQQGWNADTFAALTHRFLLDEVNGHMRQRYIEHLRDVQQRENAG